jgi:hypothetical protein
MIEPSTGWFEIKDVKNKSAKESMNTFDDVWLSRYPRPAYIGFNNGGEYTQVFEELVNNYGVKKKNSTSLNPQSNRIIERVHLTLNDACRLLKYMIESWMTNMYPLLHMQYILIFIPH